MTARVWGLAVLLAGCQAPPQTVVFAAASTSDVVQDVARQVEAETGRAVVVSVGATSVLARQIAHGAPADVLVAADPVWVDWLEGRGHAVRQRRAVARGRLVVVGPPGSRAADLESALSGRLALADPSHVPAGRYARRALESAGLWAGVEPRVVVVGDVRAALAAVEVGAADRAVVYASDARRSDRAAVVWRLPPADVRFELARLDRPPDGAGEGALADRVYRALAETERWTAAGFDAP